MTEDEKVIEHLRSCDKHPERASMYTFDNAIECIKQLRKERDHARRLFCEWSAGSDRPGEAKEDIARDNGWNNLYTNTNQHQPNGKHTGEQP